MTYSSFHHGFRWRTTSVELARVVRSIFRHGEYLLSIELSFCRINIMKGQKYGCKFLKVVN